MKKTTTLNIPGPLKLEFDYKISFKGKVIPGSHRKLILDVPKEQLTEERLQQEINNCFPEIFSKILKDNPNFQPDGEENIKIEVNNIRTGYFHTDVKLDFK